MRAAPATVDRAVTVGRALARARTALEAPTGTAPDAASGTAPNATTRMAPDATRATAPDTTRATARLESEILLAQALGWSRTRLLAYPDAMIDPDRARRFDRLVERRRDGEPIAYLTGRREFWSLDLAVTPDTLIPRAETEHLVEAVLGVVSADEPATVADIGTGTGAVAVAIGLERPRAFVLGSDRSPAAAEVAQANAVRLGAGNVSFVVADACTAMAPGRWSVIVSNPPYVAEGDPHLATGDVRFEPREALVAGPLGLDMLEALARQGPARLACGGWLALEHGAEQGPAVRAFLVKAGLGAIETLRDLAGHERVTLGRRSPAVAGARSTATRRDDAHTERAFDPGRRTSVAR